MTIDRNVFLMTVGIAGLVVDQGVASAVQGKPVVVSKVLSECLHNRNDLHCQYSYANAWEDHGIGGSYPIADMRVARWKCSLLKNSVDSLLGFCRALQVYRCPSPSAQTFLRKTSPHQPWLEGIYQKNSHAYRQWVIRDADKPAVEVLSYCTCTDLPWQEIKDHLFEVRQAIDSNAWTLADAYEFLCVYPKSSFFTRGWFSAADEAEYALCIADSIKLILQSEKGLPWEEIVKETKEQEAAANDQTERYASWGSQDAQLLNRRNDEMRFRNMTVDERREAGLSQEERERLYKLDVVRAYLYAE